MLAIMDPEAFVAGGAREAAMLARGRDDDWRRPVAQYFVIAATAFLTVVDLFATQAILPALTHRYGVSPGAMSFAVNASTIGMAIGGFATALFSRTIDRRLGVIACLVLLAVPTALLGLLPDLMTFTVLRVIQGLCMASAFTLTLAHLGEQTPMHRTAGAFAAYITGNVASNLIGRLISAGVADHFGLAANFYAFCALNLAGALLALVTIRETRPRAVAASAGIVAPILGHLRNGALLADFGIGFCILFAFIGTFTFVNYVLVRPPLSLGMMQVGFVYFVFAPAIVTTPLAGGVVRRLGARPALWGALAVALLGLPLLLAASLPAVQLGMVLVAVGTFFAQAVATGFVSRAAASDRGAASGLYLASYFLGGLAGSLVLGRLFDSLGWPACVAGVAVALGVAAVLALRIRPRPSSQEPQR
jgi:predicted MFS family arabinose efflux permease